MSDKKDEALKLAMEAIEAFLSAGTEAEEQDASDKLCEARAAIRKAQQRPQNCGTGYCSCIECPYEQPAHESAYQRGYMDGIAKGLRMEQPAQQQEPLTDEELSHIHEEYHDCYGQPINGNENGWAYERAIIRAAHAKGDA